jgi:hypothetical protein
MRQCESSIWLTFLDLDAVITESFREPIQLCAFRSIHRPLAPSPVDWDRPILDRSGALVLTPSGAHPGDVRARWDEGRKAIPVEQFSARMDVPGVASS